jgi:hypothetical protein
MARRETADSLFKNPIQVTLGLDCTFSDDGLEGILFLPEEGKGTLQFVRRKNISDDFSRPTMIKELATTQSNEKRAFLVCPGLSADGLTLYCENIGQGVIFCTRTKFGAPWSKPKKLPIVIGDEGYHRYPFVTDDGLWLFCTNTEIKDHKTANIALYARNTISEPFVFKGNLYAGEVPLNGEFARFIPATKELFFANRLDGKTRIFAVKNFDPSIAVKEP